MADFLPSGIKACHLLCVHPIIQYICHQLLWEPPAKTVPSDPEKICTGGQNNLWVMSLPLPKKKQASAGMFSVWFQCCLRGNINGWVWHACNGRKTGMSGSNSYQVVVCLQGVMRVKGERVKSEGSPSGWTNGTQETVTPRLWPLHLSRSSHSADSQLTDEEKGGRKRGLCERQMRISSLWSEHVH